MKSDDQKFLLLKYHNEGLGDMDSSKRLNHLKSYIKIPKTIKEKDKDKIFKSEFLKLKNLRR